VEDNGDGTYLAVYTATVAGLYQLHVLTADSGEPVAESPYTVRVLAAAPAPRRSLVEGDGRRHATAGEAASFTVAGCDAFGNAVGGLLGNALPLQARLLPTIVPPRPPPPHLPVLLARHPLRLLLHPPLNLRRVLSSHHLAF
jgi:hypothetical protein